MKKLKGNNILNKTNSSTEQFVNQQIRYAVEELENLKTIPDSIIREHGELRMYDSPVASERVMEFVWKGKIAITFRMEINHLLGTGKMIAQLHYDEEQTIRQDSEEDV